MGEVARRESSKRRGSSFFIAVTAMMAVVVKRASRLPLKLKTPTTREDDWKIEMKSPKKLLSNISSKTLPFIQKNLRRKKTKGEVEWGKGGVWQKAILMGDKCEPLDFSGVIYYDSNGKQVNEPPLRSPRASPVPGYLTPRSQSRRQSKLL